MSADRSSDPQPTDQGVHVDDAGFESLRQQVVWSDPAVPGPGAARRASVVVPVDYRDPAGPTIEIALARHPATDPAARSGVLVIAPDDPGSSGIALAGQLAQALPASITAAYDVIGFDHRFSGESAPLQWGLTQQEIFWAFHHPQSFDAEIRFQAELAAKAADHSLAILPHVSTRNIARDLEVIRRSLGEPKLSLLGYNYGAYIAAVYTEMFGRYADRVVLDSVLSPDWVWRNLFLNFARNCEDALDGWCAATADPAGRLGATAGAVQEAFYRALRVAGERGIMLAGVPVPLDDQFFRVLTMMLLSSRRSHPVLADVVHCALSGDRPAPSTLQLIGTMFAVPRDASTTAGQLAILCADAAWPRSLDEYASALEGAPRFMGSALNGIKAGAFWPVVPVEPATRFGVAQASGVLLVQAENDVFTGSGGATTMRKLLGDRARLVMVPGLVEHRVFPFAGQPRVDELVERFLTTGRLPDSDVLAEPARTAMQDARQVR